jgi:hypothetical protein
MGKTIISEYSQGASVFFNELVDEGIGVIPNRGRSAGKPRNVYRVYRQNLPSSTEEKVEEKKIVCFDTFDGEDNVRDIVNMIDFCDFRILRETSWSLMGTGYMQGWCKKKQRYLHNYILGIESNGVRGTGGLSVDHMDHNPYNNRRSNIKQVTREVQQGNTRGTLAGTKRARKKGARELPEGLTQEHMPKYVGYYEEKLSSGSIRNWLSVESHPAQIKGKKWTTSKSMKKSIWEKLDAAKEKLAELDG